MFNAEKLTFPKIIDSSVVPWEIGGLDWQSIVDALDYALQPIVNIHTGVCLGYEALVRNWDNAGFSSITEMFETAYQHNSLAHFEYLLWEKAINKFTSLPHFQQTTLFLNLDNRILIAPDEVSLKISSLIGKLGLHTDSFCLEISEKHPIVDFQEFCRCCRQSRPSPFKIAMDDFGAGFSGLQLLYFAEPNFIKIDRFFINGIATDAKKKLFVSKVLDLAHIIGSMVIAEGVETEKEYYVCKDIGCDYVQGYFVQHPTAVIHEIKLKYTEIEQLSEKDRRRNTEDEIILAANIDHIPPIILGEEGDSSNELEKILKKFRQNKERTFFPLLSNSREPLGIVREVHLKDYVYTEYGRNLLLNRSLGKKVQEFLSYCPVMEQTLSIEKILEVFSLTKDPEGIILTIDGKYAGFLSNTSIIKILNEKKIAIARDQNPLSKMPGNSLIGEYLARAFDDKESGYALIYFDFNDFKPFNDYYGFRRGDRAILMFADLLKDVISSTGKENFAGHLGGDDFFAGIRLVEMEISSVCRLMAELVKKFHHYTESLYDQADRESGYIISTDRSGKRKKFALLSLSCAMLILEAGERNYSTEDITRSIAGLKKEAKANQKNKTAVAVFKHARHLSYSLGEVCPHCNNAICYLRSAG